MQVSERKRRGNPALRAMAAKPPDISEYLRSQGFGPRELATLEVADSATIAGQLAFELNLPNSVELARAVEDIVTAAKNQSGMLIRTGGTLASDLAWTQLSGSSSSPARPWLEASIVKVQIEERPPPGEKVRKLLKDGEENAARELRLQVLWTRQLAEELVAIGARSSRLSTAAWTPIGRTSCCPVRQGPRHSSATSPSTSGGGYGYKRLNG